MNETFLVNENGANKLKKFYSKYEVESKNEYIVFSAKLEHCSVSLYTSNKVLFQGNDIKEETRIWRLDPDFTSTSKTPVSKKVVSAILPQCGSDEVGTGDYFGPVCVCASYVDEKVYVQCESLRITDSKVLTDEYIREVAPKLLEIVPHSLLILDNEKYNKVHEKMNLNAIKSYLHNTCYVHLSKKLGALPPLCVVDQFTPETSYYRYLDGSAEIIRSLHFETKAESKYISVAISSIIARYAFLKAMDKLSEIYGMNFPKGAGPHVDEFASDFVSKHSIQELNKVCKLHFKNTQNIQ
ncbi:MAG: ribonuclease HIII [Erysipelotrichales bacterium]|nr:ribonuclease HIII [Erysipelotrichales bacterium]